MSSPDVPAPIDTRSLAAEIEAEVRARRAAGEYPPGFERELDVLFDRFAPPEVSNDFDAALERSEDLVVMDPVIPVASRNPALGFVKRLVSKLIGWYHGWIASRSARWPRRSTPRAAPARRPCQGPRTRHRRSGTARKSAGRRAAIRDDAAWTAEVLDGHTMLAEGDSIGINEFPQIAAQISGEAAPAAPGFAEPMRAPAMFEVPPMLDFSAEVAPLNRLTHDALLLLDAHGDVRPLEQIEAEVIRFAIAHYRGQMSEVARRLQIGRSTLYRKFENLGLAPRPPEERKEPAEAH